MHPTGVICPRPMRLPALPSLTANSLSLIALCLAVLPVFGMLVTMCSGQEGGFNGSLDAPEAEDLKAVDSVAQDSVVYGTYSYEKEKQLKGAHPAEAVKLFHHNPSDAKRVFKILEKILAPRHFKETTDQRTISLRYPVQATSPGTTAIHIDALYVEKSRRRQHQSDGAVEESEFQAIKDRLERMQSNAKAISEMAEKPSTVAPAASSPIEAISARGGVPAVSTNVS